MTSFFLFIARIVKLAIVLVLLAIIVIAVAWYYFQGWLNSPLPIPADGYRVELKSGQSVGYLAGQMKAEGILDYPQLLKLYARIEAAHKIHAGEYFFTAGTTPAALLAKLVRGEVVLYQVTLLEGWTYAQALAALDKEPLLDHQLRNKTFTEQKQLLGITEPHLEGWFFPDTYSFSRNASDVGLLKQAHQKMRDFLAQEWAGRAEDLPYKTPYEALIMASIIERETGHHSERDQIAGVFVRRLQRGMKLQTDPTVIYGMGDAYKGKISRKHLQQETPYNTYVIKGLPPTPIALPSAASIKAALHPAPGNALYFVARGDGTSEFSSSLEAHNAAVRRFQLKRRADYRSFPVPSPGDSPNP
jgi:UPF0755 protein